MLPILFPMFINQLLDEVEKAGIGITIKKDAKEYDPQYHKWLLGSIPYNTTKVIRVIRYNTENHRQSQVLLVRFL